MAETAKSDGILQSLGEAIGSFLSGIPGAISSFFGGLGEGAGVHGALDWVAFILGIALLVSVVRGVRRGRVVGPIVRGAIGVALMGWAVS